VLGKVLSGMENAPVRQRPWLLAAVLGVMGGALMGAPVVLDKPAWLGALHPAWGGFLLVLAIAVAGLRPAPPARYVPLLTLLSVCAITVIQLAVFPVAAPAYDLRAASHLIAQAQAEGREIATVRQYHGEFGFYGRLVRPLVQLNATTALDWATRHPEGYLVITSGDMPDEFPDAVYTQPYRNRHLAILEGRVVHRYTTLLH